MVTSLIEDLPPPEEKEKREEEETIARNVACILYFGKWAKFDWKQSNVFDLTYLAFSCVYARL